MPKKKSKSQQKSNFKFPKDKNTSFYLKENKKENIIKEIGNFIYYGII